MTDTSFQIDVYVQPTAQVVDYRETYHGLNYKHVTAPNSRSFAAVKVNVQELLHGRVLVGHCLWQSLELLGLTHPAVDTRDVAT